MSWGADKHKKTLWQGDLEPWMDETFVKQLWLNLGEMVNVKIVKDKLSGAPGTDLNNFNSF